MLNFSLRKEIMKGKYQYWTLLLLMVALLSACKPDKLVLDPPGSKLEGINDNFVLSEVIQVDPFVIGSGNSMDVTRVFSKGTPPTITFKSADFTYSATAGDGPDYLGASGTWSFDDNEYPTLINMNNGSSQYVLKLLHTIRPQDEYLQVQLERSCGSTVTVIYQFKFARG
jgi:Domain of unknown function (DUF5004)